MHLVESRINRSAETETTGMVDFAIEVWETRVRCCWPGFPARRAVEEAYAGSDVAIVFGRYLISNLDLPFRVLNRVELARMIGRRSIRRRVWWGMWIIRLAGSSRGRQVVCKAGVLWWIRELSPGYRI